MLVCQYPSINRSWHNIAQLSTADSTTGLRRVFTCVYDPAAECHNSSRSDFRAPIPSLSNLICHLSHLEPRYMIHGSSFHWYIWEICSFSQSKTSKYTAGSGWRSHIHRTAASTRLKQQYNSCLFICQNVFFWKRTKCAQKSHQVAKKTLFLCPESNSVHAEWINPFYSLHTREDSEAT